MRARARARVRESGKVGEWVSCGRDGEVVSDEQIVVNTQKDTEKKGKRPFQTQPHLLSTRLQMNGPTLPLFTTRRQRHLHTRLIRTREEPSDRRRGHSRRAVLHGEFRPPDRQDRARARRRLGLAARLGQAVEVTEATVPITLKLPPVTVRLLRAYAKNNRQTIGTIVASALDAYLGASKGHGWAARRASLTSSATRLRV